MVEQGLGRNSDLHVLEGYVSEVYAVDGEITVDVCGYDPVFKLYGVRVLQSGGLAESNVYAAPMLETTEVSPSQDFPRHTKNSKVLVLMAGATPVCVLGCVRNEGELSNKKVSRRTISSPSGDRDKIPSVYDMSALHKGAFASLAHDGSITFDVKESEIPRFRVQLPTSGHMRVSRGGEASERATLAKALKTYMQGDAEAGDNGSTHTELVGTEATIGWTYDLWQRYTDLVGVVQAMAQILDTTALAAIASPATPAPVTIDATQAANFQAAKVLFDETTGTQPPLGPPPLMPNSVISAALRISNDSED